MRHLSPPTAAALVLCVTAASHAEAPVIHAATGEADPGPARAATETPGPATDEPGAPQPDTPDEGQTQPPGDPEPAGATEPAGDLESAGDPESAGDHESAGDPESAGDHESAGDPESAGQPEPTVARALLRASYGMDSAMEGWFAVPIACLDADGAFVTDAERCLAAIDTSRRVFDGARPIEVGPRVTVPDRMYDGFPVDVAAPQFFWWASDATEQVGRSLPCDGDDDSPPRPAVDAPHAATPESLVEQLSAPAEGTSRLRGDLDGDGRRDTLVAFSAASGEWGYDDVHGVVLVTGAGETALVDLVGEQPTPWAISERWGPYNLEQTTCFDLDGDGNAELWLSTGFESMRGHEFVELRDGRFFDVGFSTYSGD